MSRGSGCQCGTYHMWGRGAVVIVCGGTEGAVRARRRCGTIIVWKDEVKCHCCRVWRDVRGEGKVRHHCHLAGVWTWTEEGLRTRQGREGGHMIVCRGTDKVGEDNATLSSHRRAIIIVAAKWRWSYPHSIVLWVTQRARARARARVRASLTLLSLLSLLCRGGDDG